MPNVSINLIDSGDTRLLETFLNNAGKSLNLFRYYERRQITIISQHLVTCILTEDQKPVGYGHLDVENNKVWLGIALIDSSCGQGYGKRIMKYLIDFALTKRLSTINLTVDKNNIVAISLYKSFGFIVLDEINEKSVLMKKTFIKHE
jgi:RimJ/RimL family protein N-acetyltransferase